MTKRIPVMPNGNVERVFSAIQQGVTDRDAIATWLSMDRQQVVNALARLIDSKRVRKDGAQYVLNTAPALADVWR